MSYTDKLKLYNKIAKPNKFLFVTDLFLWLTHYLLGIYLAIPSSNAIICITIDDINGTIKWLIVSMCIVVLQQLLLHIENRIYYKSLKQVWNNVLSQIYDKLNVANSNNLLNNSREKIINIIYSNMPDIADFMRNLAKYSSYFIQLIITIGILIFYNWKIGICVVAVGIVVYFIKLAIHKKISLVQKKYYFYQDKSLECLLDNYNTHSLSADMNTTNTKKQSYLHSLEKSAKYKQNYGMLFSIDQVWLNLLFNVLLFGLSIFMVKLISFDVFTITLYLILTNYLSQCISQFDLCYGVVPFITNAYISMLRVKNILDIKPDDLISFGNNTTDIIGGELIFTNTSYLSNNDDVPNIEPFNLVIKKNRCTLFWGAPKCGKRAIFKMLHRCVLPSTGTITVDNINIYDFDAETYKHNIAFVTRQTKLFNDTIMNNLLISGATKVQIYTICKELGLHNKIVSLEKSYNSTFPLNYNNFSKFDIYMLGIARAYATNAEILVFYEFPQGLSNKEISRLKATLNKISKKRTTLIFSHNDWAKFLCKNIYNVDNGKITKI